MTSSRCGAFAKTLLAVYVLAAALMPLAHHDVLCHLKSSTHCTSCAVGSSGETASSAIALEGLRLPDAGRAILPTPNSPDSRRPSRTRRDAPLHSRSPTATFPCHDPDQERPGTLAFVFRGNAAIPASGGFSWLRRSISSGPCASTLCAAGMVGLSLPARAQSPPPAQGQPQAQEVRDGARQAEERVRGGPGLCTGRGWRRSRRNWPGWERRQLPPSRLLRRRPPPRPRRHPRLTCRSRPARPGAADRRGRCPSMATPVRCRRSSTPTSP